MEWHTQGWPLKEKQKTLTFGARGFVLESAIADDEEMRVIRREKCWAEGVLDACC